MAKSVSNSPIILLVSALAIAGILFFAHMDQKEKADDAMAMGLAGHIQKIVSMLPKPEAPAAEGQDTSEELRKPYVTEEAFKKVGLEIPEPLQVKISNDLFDPEKWKVDIWHPEGATIYQVSKDGIKELVQ